MDFGNKGLELRKRKGLSRDDLHKILGTSVEMIGKYKPNEMTPSIKMTKKIVGTLGISLDYLSGFTSFDIKDKKMLYCLNLLVKVSKEQSDTILQVMDSLLQNHQISSTLQKPIQS